MIIQRNERLSNLDGKSQERLKRYGGTSLFEELEEQVAKRVEAELCNRQQQQQQQSIKCLVRSQSDVMFKKDDNKSHHSITFPRKRTTTNIVTDSDHEMTTISSNRSSISSEQNPSNDDINDVLKVPGDRDRLSIEIRNMAWINFLSYLPRLRSVSSTKDLVQSLDNQQLKEFADVLNRVVKAYNSRLLEVLQEREEIRYEREFHLSVIVQLRKKLQDKQQANVNAAINSLVESHSLRLSSDQKTQSTKTTFLHFPFSRRQS